MRSSVLTTANHPLTKCPARASASFTSRSLACFEGRWLSALAYGGFIHDHCTMQNRAVDELFVQISTCSLRPCMSDWMLTAAQAAHAKSCQLHFSHKLLENRKIFVTFLQQATVAKLVQFRQHTVFLWFENLWNWYCYDRLIYRLVWFRQQQLKTKPGNSKWNQSML